MNSQRIKSSGFTLFELVVVISLVAILLVVALWRLSGLVREAERINVLTLEGQMRRVLILETAKRILNPDGPTVMSLAHTNPMDLMLEVPINYLGQIDMANSDDVPIRHWFFDTRHRQLVYRTGSQFSDIADLTHDIYYDVTIAYSDMDGDGDFSAAKDRLLGVRLLRFGGDGWLKGRSPLRNDVRNPPVRPKYGSTG